MIKNWLIEFAIAYGLLCVVGTIVTVWFLSGCSDEEEGE